ncbi:MAG: AAA family ATPase, partial [Caulobacterales bacterium]|nr:AAA family ATPase [Caulobacterales bacterium]
MAKSDNYFACQSCGATYKKWQGRCDDCGGWNSIVEETNLSPISANIGKKTKHSKLEYTNLSSIIEGHSRIQTHNNEFDRVCGGGLVKASAILLGGDPGIGKSTLLLQIVAKTAENGAKVLYISGEESASQIQERANRLEIKNSPVE